MAIFFYKGLTRNPKIEIPPSEFFPISGDWGKLWIPNLARMSPIKYYWKLKNSRVTTLTVFELLRENQLGRVKLPPPPTPRLWLKPKHEKAMCQIYEYLKSENRKSIILSGWIAGGITKTITEGRAEVIPTPNSYVWCFLYKTVLVGKCI